MDRIRALIGILASVLITAASACSTAPPTLPPSRVVGHPPVDPCPTSEFSVPFSMGSASVDGDTSELLDAAANRARSCGIEVLVVSRGYAELSSLAERRAQIAYEGIAERGVRIRDGEMIACAGSTEERAIVTIFFPVPPLPSPNLNMPC